MKVRLIEKHKFCNRSRQKCFFTSKFPCASGVVSIDTSYVGLFGISPSSILSESAQVPDSEFRHRMFSASAHVQIFECLGFHWLVTVLDPPSEFTNPWRFEFAQTSLGSATRNSRHYRCAPFLRNKVESRVPALVNRFHSNRQRINWVPSRPSLSCDVEHCGFFKSIGVVQTNWGLQM